MLITLLETFRCYNFISGVKVSNMNRHPSKPTMLSKIKAVRCCTMHISVHEWKIDNIEIEIIAFIINNRRNETIFNSQMLIQKRGLGIG